MFSNFGLQIYNNPKRYSHGITDYVGILKGLFPVIWPLTVFDHQYNSGNEAAAVGVSVVRLTTKVVDV